MARIASVLILYSNILSVSEKKYCFLDFDVPKSQSSLFKKIGSYNPL